MRRPGPAGTKQGAGAPEYTPEGYIGDPGGVPLGLRPKFSVVVYGHTRSVGSGSRAQRTTTDPTELLGERHLSLPPKGAPIDH